MSGSAEVTDNRSVRHPGRELLDALGPAIPADHARQTLSESYIEREVGRRPGERWRVLDLGCGAGDSVDLFRARDPDVDWLGLDIAGSREAGERTREDAPFRTYDGVAIPLEDAGLDLVYCKQVLEHVRRPAPVLAEVRRVLRPGGVFAGSTSQLEPFHSASMWNYTPAGFAELLSEAGMHLLEIRPGIDGLTLIARRLVPRRTRLDRLWAGWWGGRSPLNRALDSTARLRGMDAAALNATKLVFCGQFSFLAERPLAQGQR